MEICRTFQNGILTLLNIPESLDLTRLFENFLDSETGRKSLCTLNGRFHPCESSSVNWENIELNFILKIRCAHNCFKYCY